MLQPARFAAGWTTARDGRRISIYMSAIASTPTDANAPPPAGSGTLIHGGKITGSVARRSRRTSREARAWRGCGARVSPQKAKDPEAWVRGCQAGLCADFRDVDASWWDNRGPNHDSLGLCFGDITRENEAIFGPKRQVAHFERKTGTVATAHPPELHLRLCCRAKRELVSQRRVSIQPATSASVLTAYG